MTEPHASAAAGGAAGLTALLLEAVSLDYAAILWGLAGGLFALARSEPAEEGATRQRTSRQAALFLFLSMLSAVALSEVVAQVGRGLLGDHVTATALHRAAAFVIGFGAQSAAPRLLNAAIDAVSAFLMRVFGGGNKP